MRPRICTLALLVTFVGACGARRTPPPIERAQATASGAVAADTALDDVAQQVENLRAFARLYGYVRWFHPSDEASEVDWTAMAILGAGMVRDASSPEALQDALTRLFAPVAPELRIYREGEPAPDLGRLTPASTAGLTPVVWEHNGVGGGAVNSTYISKRNGRSVVIDAWNEGFATATAAVDAAPLRGKQVRLRASVRAMPRDEGSNARLWLRIDRPDHAMGFFDNMADRPIRGASWSEYEIVGEVAADAEKVVFGGFLKGHGAAYFDDFSLEVRGDSGFTPVQLKNPGFAAGTSDWKTIAQGYAYEAVDEPARPDAKALKIASVSDTRGPEPLFPTTVAVGEAIDEPIGRGLRVQVPLALWSRDEHTLPRSSAFAALQATLAEDRERRPQAYSSLAHRDLRAADVVIAWNILQHFYPYFEEVKVDWPAALDEALAASVAASDDEAFLAALSRMFAGLADGHAMIVSVPALAKLAELPVRFEWIEDRLVVVASADPQVQRGDVVVSLDGVPAAAAVADEETRISGSPQWRRSRAMTELIQGTRGAPIELRVQRGTEELAVKLAYSAQDAPKEPTGPAIRREPDGVYVVDLGRASWEEIEKQLTGLARAPGVVFDLRDYPNGNHEILQHLLTGPDTSKEWMQVPQIVRPDHVRPGSHEKHAWHMTAKSPHIAGKVAFLTGPGAISYAESVMGLVAHYRLGEIVGAPTAGANGNINPFDLPGELRMVFTGMKVLRHDGGQHHVVGVQPTIPAGRTIAGVRAGRDEVLGRGLAVVRGP